MISRRAAGGSQDTPHAWVTTGAEGGSLSLPGVGHIECRFAETFVQVGRLGHRLIVIRKTIVLLLVEVP